MGHARAAPGGHDSLPNSRTWPFARVSSLQAVGQRLLLVPCYVGPSVEQLKTWQLASSEQVSEKSQREGIGKLEVSLLKPNLRLTHHFSHIVF